MTGILPVTGIRFDKEIIGRASFISWDAGLHSLNEQGLGTFLIGNTPCVDERRLRPVIAFR